MLTNIEIETLTAVKSACHAIVRKLERKKEIDWEQRRYEIARQNLQAMLSDPEEGRDPDILANISVKYADGLIENLKRTTNEKMES